MRGRPVEAEVSGDPGSVTRSVCFLTPYSALFYVLYRVCRLVRTYGRYVHEHFVLISRFIKILTFSRLGTGAEG